MSGFIKAAVIGHPVSHSKSPLIHNYWIEKYGLHGAYEAVDLSPEIFEEGLRRLVEQSYRGFNLTIPHKEAALTLCHEVDQTAKAIGAVNTITVREGTLYGTNTDSFGFIQNIKGHAPDFSFTGCSALVLGAGGAARAVLHGLLQEEVQTIYLTNRTRQKAEALAYTSEIKIIDWAARHEALSDADLLVNTTPLGMTGQQPLELDLSALPAHVLVNDIVYAPLDTSLLKEARNRGNPVVTGIGMLLHQARPAFESWFGVLPDVTPELEKMVLDA